MDNHLEQLVTCSVCLDRFKKPKILPCQHTFCLQPCLKTLLIGQTIKCPQCRTTHKLSRQGLAGLPNNLTIISILELPSKNNFAKKENNCQECLKKSCDPEICSHCELKLCSECSKIHTQQLIQTLTQSVNQNRKIFSKFSGKLTKLEEKKETLKSESEILKYQIKKKIDNYVCELKKRQEVLINSVDQMTANQISELQIEKENLEMELTSMTSQSTQTQSLCRHLTQVFSSSNKSDNVLQNKALSMMSQNNEHLRNLKLFETHIEDKLKTKLRFSNCDDQLLMSQISHFGEITCHSNVFDFDDITIGDNDLTINNNFEHLDDIYNRSEQVSSYVPSFLSSLNDSSAHSSGHDIETRLNIQPPGFSQNLPRWTRLRQTPQRLTLSDPSDWGHDLGINHDLLGASPSQRILLQIYRNKGLVKRSFGLKGSDIGCLNWPRGVAITPQQRIVIADSSNHRVQIFTSRGESPIMFGEYGNLEGQLDCLAGVHVTGQGWIIVSDRYNHRIQIFDSSGRFIRMFGQEGTGEGDLSYPWGVATDNMGFVYVCDKDNHRVQVFALDGQFIRKFGRLGQYDGQFDSPHYIVVTRDNKIIVSDSGNHRMQIFDKYGRFILKFGHQGSLEGEFKYPRGVTVDSHGNIIVVDSGNNRVQIFQNNGTFVASFGERGTGLSQLRDPEGIGILQNDEIVVSDRGNHRIQVY